MQGEWQTDKPNLMMYCIHLQQQPSHTVCVVAPSAYTGGAAFILSSRDYNTSQEVKKVNIYIDVVKIVGKSTAQSIGWQGKRTSDRAQTRDLCSIAELATSGRSQSRSFVFNISKVAMHVELCIKLTSHFEGRLGSGNTWQHSPSGTITPRQSTARQSTACQRCKICIQCNS